MDNMLHETTEHDEGSSPTTGGSVIAYFVGSVQFLLVMTNGWPREGINRSHRVMITNDDNNEKTNDNKNQKAGDDDDDSNKTTAMAVAIVEAPVLWLSL